MLCFGCLGVEGIVCAHRSFYFRTKDLSPALTGGGHGGVCEQTSRRTLYNSCLAIEGGGAQLCTFQLGDWWGGHLSASRFLVSANVALVYQRVVGGGGPGCAN